MGKLYWKIILCGFIAFVLSVVDFRYSPAYILGLLAAILIIVYGEKTRFESSLKQYRREMDHELKEVAGENKFHYKVLNHLIKTMNLPMIFIDKDGIIIFTNQSFRNAFQIEHLRGKKYKDIFTGQLLNVVEQSYVFERKWNSVVCIENKYYQIDTTPVFRDKVVFDGSIILFTDVSQMKEIEKMQKQFFSDISHELKTPMSAIIGSVEILRKDGMKSKETFDEFSHILLKESYRMQNIINDILELSRLEQPQVKISPTWVNINSLIKESMELFDPLAKEKQISLIYQNDIKEDILIDYSTVKTILNNLLSNAIKYSNGGVVNLKTKIKNNQFVFIIQDEGIGISKREIPLIFDRFYQVDRARSSKISTGLGLSIVKRIVELNKGTIDVESELGIGSTFIVQIPLENTKISHNEDII